jgi:hypothetical protein
MKIASSSAEAFTAVAVFLERPGILRRRFDGTFKARRIL